MTEVIINGESKQFVKFADAMKWIEVKMAYWNNFENHKQFDISVIKVPDENALSVVASESVNTAEMLS